MVGLFVVWRSVSVEATTTRVRPNHDHSSLDYSGGPYESDWRSTPDLQSLVGQRVCLQGAETVILTCTSRGYTMMDRTGLGGRCIVYPQAVVGHTLDWVESVVAGGEGGGRLHALKCGHIRYRDRCEQVVVHDDYGGHIRIRIHIQGTRPLTGRRIVSGTG